MHDVDADLSEDENRSAKELPSAAEVGAERAPKEGVILG